MKVTFTSTIDVPLSQIMLLQHTTTKNSTMFILKRFLQKSSFVLKWNDVLKKREMSSVLQMIVVLVETSISMKGIDLIIEEPLHDRFLQQQNDLKQCVYLKCLCRSAVCSANNQSLLCWSLASVLCLQPQCKHFVLMNGWVIMQVRQNHAFENIFIPLYEH